MTSYRVYLDGEKGFGASVPIEADSPQEALARVWQAHPGLRPVEVWSPAEGKSWDIFAPREALRVPAPDAPPLDYLRNLGPIDTLGLEDRLVIRSALAGMLSSLKAVAAAHPGERVYQGASFSYWPVAEGEHEASIADIQELLDRFGRNPEPENKVGKDG